LGGGASQVIIVSSYWRFALDPSGLENYLPLLFIFLLGVLFAGAFLLLSYVFGPKKPTPEKLDVFECGVPITGDARSRFSVKFFIVAMIFLLFVIFSKLKGHN